MPSEAEYKEEKDRKKENPRISVKIQDDFDYRVVSKMAKNRDTSLSGAMRDIVHQWILSNAEMLKKTYGVDIDEINEEIFLETASLVYDKELKPLEVKLIDELSRFFEMVEVVGIQDLADHFGVPIKTIKKILYTHAKVIKSKGLNLTVNEGRIFKRD
ncbi:MAG: hypothetical protein E3J90_03710 [Promethearchaeota archaeon]|nr:MAG: hypothetical protein E3J90_03710 [Candidatus Lokiarchaeota archaeon]